MEIVISKLCKKCFIEKDIKEMIVHHIKENIKYYRNVCIECDKEYRREKRKANYSDEKYSKQKERNKESSKKWTINNRERKKELNKKRSDPENKEKYAISRKLWRESNKNKEKEYSMRRYANRTHIQKLKNNMRNSIRLYLNRKGFSKNTKTEKILGCSFEEFKIYLESKFESWMNWDNHGRYNGELNYGWDIDHIIPLSSTNKEEDILKLNHFTNLQPLCSKVNRHIKRDL